MFLTLCLSNAAQPQLLGRFQRFLYQKLQFSFLLSILKLEFKNVAPQGSVHISKTGIRSRCRSPTSRLGIKCKLPHITENFNKRIMQISLGVTQSHLLDRFKLILDEEKQVRNYLTFSWTVYCYFFLQCKRNNQNKKST